MAIKRDAVRPVELPSSSVVCDAIGGEVVVRGMDMPQLLEFVSERRRLAVPREGEGEKAAQERAAGALVPLVLHWCVVLDDGLPVYSVEQCRAFGARHADEALRLFGVAMSHSGMDTAAEKKS